MLQPEEESNAQRDPPKTAGELGTLQKLERSHFRLKLWWATRYSALFGETPRAIYGSTSLVLVRFIL